jgi:hypothetical protein
MTRKHRVLNLTAFQLVCNSKVTGPEGKLRSVQMLEREDYSVLTLSDSHLGRERHASQIPDC